jgi:hypothetical protein
VGRSPDHEAVDILAAATTGNNVFLIKKLDDGWRTPAGLGLDRPVSDGRRLGE